MKILISNGENAEILGGKEWVMKNLALLLFAGDIEVFSPQELEEKINEGIEGADIDQIYFLTDEKFTELTTIKEEA